MAPSSFRSSSRWRAVVEAGRSPEPGPAASSAPVDVVDLDTGLGEEVLEGAVADAAQLGGQAGPVDPERRADVVEDDLGGDAIEREVAAGGQRGEAVFDLALESSAGGAGERPVAQVEAELAVLRCR